MTQFHKDASVHPKTVTEISRREPEKRGRKYYGRRESGEVTIQQMNPTVWRLAREAAGGDIRRIEKISTTEVFIHNRPDWR